MARTNTLAKYSYILIKYAIKRLMSVASRFAD